MSINYWEFRGMKSSIIEERRTKILNWINGAKESFQKIMETKVEGNIVQLVRELNIWMAGFKEIYIPTIELVIEIASGSQGAYKSLGAEPPQKYDVMLFDKEYNIDLSSKEREDIANVMFPELKDAYKTMQEILSKYQQIQEKLVTEVRNEVDKLYSTYEVVLERIEKRLMKSSTPLAEDLISGLTELYVMDKILRREIGKYRVKGQHFWNKSKTSNR